MATMAGRIAWEERFFQKMAAGLVIFILFAFGQFALRGLPDYRHAPLITHLHGATMMSWLGLFVIQSTLAQRMDLALHRRLGWLGLALVLAIPPIAIATCVTILRLHALPPFFTPSFFFVLVTVESLTFAGLVVTAIAMRRRTDWHRRLIIGAAIVLLEPALGRLLPLPLMGPWGEWVAMLLQLIPVAIVARHDLASQRRVHRATVVVGSTIVLVHVIVTLLAMAPSIVAFVGTF